MKRIVIVHNHPIHYQDLLFGELKRAGLDFSVLFVAGSSENRFEVADDRLLSYAADIGFRGRYEKAPKWSTARFIYLKLSELQPDVIMISGYYDVAGWVAWLWSEIHHVPKILWAESNAFDHPRRAVKEALKRFLVSRFAGAHVYGESNKQYLVQLGLPPSSILSQRAVVNTGLFRLQEPRSELSFGPRILLYVGRFAPEKNLEFLLRAFSRFSQSGEKREVILALVGYGPLQDKLVKIASELNCGDAIQFWGRSSQADLAKLYWKADALILPSVAEPWGLVAAEAMLCGVPILVSDQCGCKADLITPDTGWTFSPFDENALTRALEVFAATPRERLRKMGEAAFLLASKYDPAKTAARVIASIALFCPDIGCDE